MYTLRVQNPALQSANCREVSFQVSARAEDCGLQSLLWPNGDGIAEVLDLGSYQGRIRLEVYDLRGRLVYQQADYANDWQGLELESGIYVYHVWVEGECPREFTGRLLKVD
ncbi:MAG TPA: hypothetical protein ENJ82_16275 [Bacteroidetes bacterium]|nr:hypothetical protein [Bacteroidota bacterium]